MKTKTIGLGALFLIPVSVIVAVYAEAYELTVIKWFSYAVLILCVLALGWIRAKSKKEIVESRNSQ